MIRQQTIGETQPLKPLIAVGRTILLIASLGCFAIGTATSFAQTTNEIRIVELQGTVEISPKGATTWVLTQTNQAVYPYDRLRTGPNSRVALRWSDAGVVPLGALTEVEILPPHARGADSGLRLIRGILSFFHRDKPGRIRVLTRGATAGIEGTEFVVEVTETNGAERTTLSVIDGGVTFTNEQAALVLTNGQQAVAEPGQAPMRTAGFIAQNILQWCFYYPAVLDLNDLPLTSEDQNILSESLAAYRQGDLLAALAKYPAGRRPGSDAGRVYHAALLLSVGQVEQTEARLSALTATAASEKSRRLASALRQLIAAVKREPQLSTLNSQLSTSDQLPTELLAASYYEQSRAVTRASLNNALALAKQAVAKSPEFGFGWERVAELEFSFGRTGRAMEALNKSLTLAPRNAQALALRGFLLAAQNKTREAIEWFDRALAVDSALGNAWLGRGLCRIRRGDVIRGREDLLIAAALEPQRATLRSYLGKAWSDAGDDQRARKEFDLARKLDLNDPTSWLYSALNNERHNRLNEAIRDLEKSRELNQNRGLYRSRLLLDQDRAVRSANLARIYDEAGLTEVAVRETQRGVAADYANYSSHLFLANNYSRLNGLTDGNLRYETPAVSEFLVASLLAPVGGSVLSQRVSQQEYSRLFEKDRIGISSLTSYRSDGDWLQSASQFGLLGPTAYALDADYWWFRGDRAENQQEGRILGLTIKHELDPRSSVYLHVRDAKLSGGDLLPVYDPDFKSGFSFTERQRPILLAGFHHEWSPASHTLLLFGWLTDDFGYRDPIQNALMIEQLDGVNALASEFPLNGFYRNSFNIFSLEAQQTWQAPNHQMIVGTRLQWGTFDTRAVLTNVPEALIEFFIDFDTQQELPFVFPIQTDFLRASGYGYYTWRPFEQLSLIGGAAYDHLEFPANHLLAPLSGAQKSAGRFSPKAGLVWDITSALAFRTAYTRSTAGASFEQSFQLEPSQVAGINQLYRSIIPDAVAGANVGARFETAGFVFDYKSRHGTFLSIGGDLLRSTVNRDRGAFLFNNGFGPFFTSTPERLDYEERSLFLQAYQLIGSEWSVGFNYRLSNAQLKDDFTEVENGLENPDFLLLPRTRQEAALHSLLLFANYQHSSGFFGRVAGRWLSQNNHASAPGQSLAGDQFWQLDLYTGYRSRRGRFEITAGLLNVTGRDYRLNPLNVYGSIPRHRTFTLSARVNF